jgi:hypothetical protein
MLSFIAIAMNDNITKHYEVLQGFTKSYEVLRGLTKSYEFYELMKFNFVNPS